MKKIVKLLLIISFILLVKFLSTFSINELVISKYNKDKYSGLIKVLYAFNFQQSYIVYYNDGNILYKKEKYTDAVEKYKKAIDRHPPQKRVCDVRINMSLAIIKEIDETYNYESAYKKLEEAKNNLYGNNCANPSDDSGYSNDAEKLEEEIKQLINQLQNSSSSNQQKTDDQTEDSKQEEDYSEIEEELKEIEEQSNSTRQQEMNDYENMGSYEYYPGKRW